MTAESTSHAADIEATSQLVATVKHSHQNKDPEEFLRAFHPDAIWTTAHGKVLIGLDAISEFVTVSPAPRPAVCRAGSRSRVTGRVSLVAENEWWRVSPRCTGCYGAVELIAPDSK
ncbi:hypothetical protein DWB77_07470 [Streptomyces hundungensis]|uniref:Uncharacterized protein n=1 Tax=Streptomyces hundungensis TaxID=1077946 RepID=A0A387HQY0_9ACTN|nr:SgcJ/EcaC family oxidoreductase [Streptomyces hundungensis]AYG85253.1 hypothetical protein DWB77_07470 [Streptomyces hundungensis]